jgi:biopolymer transport protein ExbD
MMKSRYRTPSRPPTLMLTSLLDMFTIILLFLIVSFEAEDYGFKLDSELTLPQSSSKAELKAAVNVSVNRDRIVVFEKEIARLQDGEAAAEYHQKQQIPELVKALRAEYERRFGPNAVWGTRVGDGEKAGENEPIVVLQADRELNYRTLYLILRSAAQAGFFKYRLAVIKT